MKKESKVKKNYWKSYNYHENKVIGDELSFGDKQCIAEVTGLSYSYIKMIFSGKRHNDTAVDYAKKILASRDPEVLKMQDSNA